MLPFLKDKDQSIASVITSKRSPESNSKPEEHSEGMLAAAHDLKEAIKADDVHAIAAALKAAFELADLEPHAEGPHTEEE